MDVNMIRVDEDYEPIYFIATLPTSTALRVAGDGSSKILFDLPAVELEHALQAAQFAGKGKVLRVILQVVSFSRAPEEPPEQPLPGFVVVNGAPLVDARTGEIYEAEIFDEPDAGTGEGVQEGTFVGVGDPMAPPDDGDDGA